MVRIPETAVAPKRKRAAVVRDEVQQAINLLGQGEGAIADGWRVVQLERTRSIQTVRAILSRLRKEEPGFPFGRGAVRVYEVDGNIFLATRV